MMEDATRTPLQQLESEAVYLLRESAALFERPALVLRDDSRSKVLAELARRAFLPDTCPLAEVGTAEGDFDAFLSAEAGTNFEVWPLFGKRPKNEEPWKIFPLASWSARDIETFVDGGDDADSPRLLRLCTVGEAESGKSTVVEGLMEASRGKQSKQGANATPPGLRVHRHLLTARRRLFIIDPPGQEPYSHGLLAAASAAEVALLVLDARRGLTTTSKRQAFLLALMGVPHLVVVVNKMDLVDYSRETYERIVAQVEATASLIEIKNLSFVPLAAGRGNLDTVDDALSWYEGPSLLTYLEGITPGSLKNMTDLRLPVQRVSGNGQTLIGGRLASGRLAVGDRVVVLPSGQETEVYELRCGSESQDVAFAGDSVTIKLADPGLVNNGDIIASPRGLPTRSSELEAVLLWLDANHQRQERRYLLHHGTRLVSAHVGQVLARLRPESLSWEEGGQLDKGAIGRVRMTTGAPLYFDSYTSNRQTGAFAILDWETRAILGAGVLRGPALEIPDVTACAERLASANVVKDPTLVSMKARRKSYRHQAAVLWFTGLSGSGKSAVAKVVEQRLFDLGCHTLFLRRAG